MEMSQEAMLLKTRPLRVATTLAAENGRGLIERI
jgi:hypothetical protein